MSHLRSVLTHTSEVKFVVDAATGAAVTDWMRHFLMPDPNGTGPHGDQYRISTIYFDTDDRDVFHRRGSFGRAKYRVRRYNNGDSVFFERKLRRPGVLAKRRTQVPLAPRYSELHEWDAWDVRWFRRRVRVRGLRPVCQIDYTRVARHAYQGALRVTVDSGLQCASRTTLGFAPIIRETWLPDQMIVELKVRQHVPAICKQLIETLGLVPRTLSKYRSGLASVETDLLAPPIGPLAIAEALRV